MLCYTSSGLNLTEIGVLIKSIRKLINMQDYGERCLWPYLGLKILKILARNPDIKD